MTSPDTTLAPGTGLPVGSVAPDFTLPDENKRPVTLSEVGAPVLLVFFPFAWSGVCTSEFCELRDDLSVFTDAGVQVFGVSTDTAQSLKPWVADQGYTFPFLSDFWPHGAVAQAYNVFFDKAGMALRGTFLLDADRVVRFAEVNMPGDRRDQSAWKRAVESLAG